MKKFILTAAAAFALVSMDLAAAQYGFVNFKDVLEKSKLGQQEQAAFESLKEQMEKVLQEKDKELNEIASKFNDPDYIDTLSPEAENDLKHKFRTLSQELNEKQGQFYQALQQAQVKIMAKLAEYVSKASEKLAKDKKLDAVFNQDATFFWNKDLNVSADVIKEIDAIFEKEAKEAPAKPVEKK